MNNNLLLTAALAATCFLAAATADAHDGRRFQIEVVDNQLRAQGVNSNARPIDPAGPRPYFNALHDHFADLGNGTFVAGLPGYDMGLGSDALVGDQVTWTLTGASKWEGVDALIDPDNMGRVIGTPDVDLVPLSAGEAISVSYDGDVIDTATLGGFTFVDDYDGRVRVNDDGVAFVPNGGTSNGFDLDPAYLFTGTPQTDGGIGPVPGTLFVLESVLSTDDPAIADSETIYTIFSPSGNGPVERLHFASLYLEEVLGTPTTPIPEPTSLALLGVASLTLRRRR